MNDPTTENSRALESDKYAEARLLIGWLEQDQAALLMAGRRKSKQKNTEFQNAIIKARNSVASRNVQNSFPSPISPLPQQISDHIIKLKESGVAADLFASGYAPALVDLKNLIAVQEYVFITANADKTADADYENLAKLAEITLPFAETKTIPAQYDANAKTWIILSHNLNTRITAHFGGPVQQGTIGFGFSVGVKPSLLQVVKFKDRYFLRDGYHRAVRILKSGVSAVPALFKEVFSLEELGIRQPALQPSLLLGDRPPTLSDYTDDAVSVSAVIPSHRKMIVIQGLEMTPVF